MCNWTSQLVDKFMNESNTMNFFTTKDIKALPNIISTINDHRLYAMFYYFIVIACVVVIYCPIDHLPVGTFSTTIVYSASVSNEILYYTH